MMEDDLAPGIFDAVMKSIDDALSLGKQGSLDAWYVLEAAERFKAVIPKRSDKPVRPANYPAFAIMESGLASV
jgi:hypothetical protein